MRDVAVDCEKCGSRGLDPCITSGGNISPEPHRVRRRAGYSMGSRSGYGYESNGSGTAACAHDTDPANAIKLAMWFISKSGGLEQAKRAFNAAAMALESFA